MSSKASIIRKKDESDKTIIINSGFCSGNNNVREHINGKNVHLGKCGGTVRSYNAEKGGDTVYIGGNHNTGAFSGNTAEGCGDADVVAGSAGSSKKDSGSKARTGSEVIGTLQSFNAGISPATHCSLKVSISNSDHEMKKNLEESFYDAKTNLKWSNDKVNKEDKCNGNGGTQFSFNVVDGGSNIDMAGATINSGYCSGNKDVDVSIYNHNRQGHCKGTEESFNATSGGQILLEGVNINSGGYAGNSKRRGC